MPEYTFECERCANKFSVFMSMSEYTGQQECPECNSIDIFRDFGADQVLTKDGNPRTVGMLAEQNARKKGIQ